MMLAYRSAVIRRHYSLKSRWCQPIGGAFHEADDPCDIIDAYRSLLPLEIQASLRCLDKSLGICICHKPMPALPLPSCVGANFATKFDQQGVPPESYAAHLTSPVESRIVPSLPQGAIGKCDFPARS
jgi:hypothetical protein